MPQANSPAPRHSLRVPPYMGNRGGGAKRVASPDRMDPQAPWIGRRCCAALILSRWNATRLLSAPPAKGSARIENHAYTSNALLDSLDLTPSDFAKRLECAGRAKRRRRFRTVWRSRKRQQAPHLTRLVDSQWTNSRNREGPTSSNRRVERK